MTQAVLLLVVIATGAWLWPSSPAGLDAAGLHEHSALPAGQPKAAP